MTSTNSQHQVSENAEGIFSILADPQCRQILSSISKTPRTISDISQKCNIPISTVYTKIPILQQLKIIDVCNDDSTNDNRTRFFKCNLCLIQINLDVSESKISILTD